VTDPDLGSLSESGTCSLSPVGSYKGGRLLSFRPFDFPPSPRPASQVFLLLPKSHGTRLSDRHFLVHELLKADPPQTILRTHPTTTPPSTSHPYVLKATSIALNPTHSFLPQPQGRPTRPPPMLVRRKTPSEERVVWSTALVV